MSGGGWQGLSEDWLGQDRVLLLVQPAGKIPRLREPKVLTFIQLCMLIVGRSRAMQHAGLKRVSLAGCRCARRGAPCLTNMEADGQQRGWSLPARVQQSGHRLGFLRRKVEYQLSNICS